MTTGALAARPDAGAIEHALVMGDLSRLTPDQRLSYYNQICQSLDLNPLTKPFAYITLNGKLVLYALKDCTEQLRSKRGVSVTIAAREVVEDCYIVTARASLPAPVGTAQPGRQDESIGAVSIGGLKGEARANAMMKAETKAKRRVTLSICGLGMLDETEVETIPTAGYVVEPQSPMPIPAQLKDANDRAFAGTLSDEGPHLGVDLPPGTVLIVRVDTKDTKNKNVRQSVLTIQGGPDWPANQTTVSTINPKFAALAEQCCQDRTPVFLTTTQKGSWWNVATLDIAAEIAATRVQHEHSEPVDVDSIPF